VKELERSLGLPAVIAISVSAMLGSGIFVLPGLAAAQAGPSVWLAYLLAGLCVLPAATCKAELATALPTSGGTYVYLERIFGPLVGTIAGIGLWASMLLKSAFALLGFGTYLLVVADLPLRPTALLLLLVITLLNIIGVRKVGKAQVVIVTLSLLGLAVLVAFGLPRVQAQHLRNPFPHGLTGLLAAAGFVFVSYNGVTKVAAVAEEVRNPQRNLPLGILVSLALIVVVYGLVTFTLVGNVPIAELGSDLKPIHTLAARVGGTWAGKIAALLGVLTMVSMANAGLLAASRFPFAMAREQLLPTALTVVHRRFQTPVVAILLTGVAMAVSISFFDIASLAKLASAIVIMLYVSENVAVVVFRESRVHWYKPSFVAPLYPWVPALGVVSGLALLIMLGTTTVLLALGLVVVPGMLTFLIYGRGRTDRKGVVGQRINRADLLQADHPAATHEVLNPAEAVVALFGGERSPEMLVEVGAALARSGSVQVAHLTEVPEQMALDDVLEEDGAVQALRRRVFAAAERQGAQLDFHAIVARDLAGTVHQVTSRAECHWLVMEWQGPSRKSLLPYNPIGWLLNHLDTNLALVRDAGIRYVREIVAYPEPGPHDALVVRSAAHLAEIWGGRLTFVRFVADGADPAVVEAEAAYLGQLELLVEVPPTLRILRGNDIASSIISETSAYDLLVLGQPNSSLIQALRGTLHAKLTKHSACSVLSLKTPRAQTHTALRRHAGLHSASGLMRYLTPGALQARLPISKKEQLFEHIGQVFEAVLLGRVNARVISAALWEREKTQNTSVGKSIALPHATVAGIPSYLGVFTTAAPIDYAGPDGSPVDVFFVTLCPPSDRNTHLELLRDIAALTLQTDLLVQLRQAESGQDMQSALEDCCRLLTESAAAADATDAAAEGADHDPEGPSTLAS